MSFHGFFSESIWQHCYYWPEKSYISMPKKDDFVTRAIRLERRLLGRNYMRQAWVLLWKKKQHVEQERHVHVHTYKFTKYLSLVTLHVHVFICFFCSYTAS